MSMYLLMIALSTSVVPLQYDPYIDTYQSLGERAMIQSSGYAGNVAFEMMEALDKEYQRTYQLVIDHLEQCQKKTRMELKSFQLSSEQIEKIIYHRKFEAQCFREEEMAWRRWRNLECDYTYAVYADGSARLKMPQIVSNHMTYCRIQNLISQYQEVFSNEVTKRCLWGKWDSEKHTTISFERDRSNVAYVGNAEVIYAMHDGTLSVRCKKDNITHSYLINILGTEDAHFLECNDRSVELPDQPFCQMIETILLHQLEAQYQKKIHSFDQWIQKCLSNPDPETYWMERWANQATEARELLKKSHTAWKEWREIAFRDKKQLLPSGAVFAICHSPQHNQAIVRRIVDLNEELAHNSTQINALILGKWECPRKKEVWEFKENKDAFSYEVSQAGQCIEKGTYSFIEGNLILTPIKSSKKNSSSIQLNE
ncbi:MAG: hypothetical protein H7A37_07560 [Chlamydiales bacterium]|nr:hypothetical protein [Chlamydiales bacterium]